MRVEVKVGHEIFHFECDKVIDGTSSAFTESCKLVIMKGEDTIAVFNNWTYWKTIPEAKKADSEGPVEINESTKRVILALQTPEGQDTAVKYHPDRDLFIFYLRGNYTMVMSRDFIEDYLQVPKCKKHKVCQNCGKKIGPDGGDTLCRECLDKMPDAT